MSNIVTKSCQELMTEIDTMINNCTNPEFPEMIVFDADLEDAELGYWD